MMDAMSDRETRILYYVDDEETPYSIKLPIPSDQVTLRDFKQVFAPKTNYKFFFKSYDDEVGIVKEELVDDDARLPLFKTRVVSYVVTADGSNVSEGSQSQITEVSGAPHNSHHRSHGHYSSVSDSCDTTTCTETETESIISSRRGTFAVALHSIMQMYALVQLC